MSRFLLFLVNKLGKSLVIPKKGLVKIKFKIVNEVYANLAVKQPCFDIACSLTMAEMSIQKTDTLPPTSIKAVGLGGISAEDAQAGLYSIDRLSRVFATSARRWELIVYPSMFAFVVLAAYGFYLVFSLTKDMHYLSYSVDANMTVMASNMQAMSENIAKLTNHINTMTTHVESMSRDTSTLEPMLTAIKSLDHSVQSMSVTTHNIRDEFGSMNRSVTRPLNFFNNFIPW
ncbi:MAG: hypothetical protein WCP34_07115 [Pseudomonadota bacterium]